MRPLFRRRLDPAPFLEPRQPLRQRSPNILQRSKPCHRASVVSDDPLCAALRLADQAAELSLRLPDSDHQATHVVIVVTCALASRGGRDHPSGSNCVPLSPPIPPGLLLQHVVADVVVWPPCVVQSPASSMWRPPPQGLAARPKRCGAGYGRADCTLIGAGTSCSSHAPISTDYSALVASWAPCHWL